MSHLKNLPWRAVDPYLDGLRIVDSAGFEIIDVAYHAHQIHPEIDKAILRDVFSDEHAEAVHLLTAAPDMAEALRCWMATDPTFWSVTDEAADELIAMDDLAAPLAIAIKKTRAALAKAAGGAQ